MVLLMGYFIHKKYRNQDDAYGEMSDEEDEELKRKGLVRICSVPVAVVSVIVFILTENITSHGTD
jgi:hypothetical protein